MKKLRVTIKPAGDKWQASAEDDNAVAEGISPQEALGELIMQKGRSINVTVYERNHEKIVALLMA